VKIHPLEENPASEPEPEAKRPLLKRWALPGSLACMALLLAFYAFDLASWNGRQRRPPAWDDAVELRAAMDSRDALRSGDLGRLWRGEPRPGKAPLPPLYSLSLAPFGGGRDPGLALWANYLYFALLLLSVWGAGRTFANSWRALAGAVLFCAMPETLSLLRSPTTDLALAAWVAAAYWALFESDGFRLGVPSALFALAAAAAGLTKWSAPAFFLPALALLVKAVPERPALRNALAAFAAAALPLAAWLLPELSRLLPRLADSAGAGPPVWEGLSALHYLMQMAEGMDFPLFVAGMLSLAVPTVRRGEDQRGLLMAWFIFSYLFWSLIPNRQLRFLLPGLAPLAILCGSGMPRYLLGALCAFQMVTAANYSRGFLPEISFQAGLPIGFFSRWIPAAEDWKTSEMLSAAGAARDGTRPFSEITLCAEHPFLNRDTLDWELRRMGLRTLSLRGAGPRVCDLSEFLLIKTGSLGPEDLSRGLLPVQLLVFDPGEWFLSGWREIRRWSLPDGSDAVLFQQKRLAKPPLTEGKAHFDYYEESGVAAKDLDVDFGAFDAAAGVYPLVRVRACELSLKGLRVSPFSLELEGLSLVPVESRRPASPDDVRAGRFRGRLDDFRLLRLSRARVVSFSAGQESLSVWACALMPWLKGPVVNLSPGRVFVAGELLGGRAAAAFRPSISGDGGSFELLLESASWAGVPIPPFLFGPERFQRWSLGPVPGRPLAIAFDEWSLADGRLALSSRPSP
jgi:hypothetical protein